MEPLIVKAGIINEEEVDSTFEDSPSLPMTTGKGLKQWDHDPMRKSKDQGNTEPGVSTPNDTNLDGVKPSRKQALKKWATSLNKIRSALLVFVSKVHATTQLESSLKLEKDTLNSLAVKLQHEVLSELDSRSLNTMAEMEKVVGDDAVDLGKESGNYARGAKVDRELIHKIVTAVRAQKRKLLVTIGRIEDLKKEKISSEASIFSKQKRISELEKKLQVMESYQGVMSANTTQLHTMLVNMDETPASSHEERHQMAVPNHGYTHMHGVDAKDTQRMDVVESQSKVKDVVERVQNLLRERNELKAEVEEVEAKNRILSEELTTLKDGMRSLCMTMDENNSVNNENILLELSNLKARKEELECFHEETMTWHQAITQNLSVLEGILNEELDHDGKKLLGLDYVLNKLDEKSLLLEPFRRVVSFLPDFILKINLLKKDYKEFDEKLQKAELRQKDAESEVLKREQLLKVSASSQRELEDAKHLLKDIHYVLQSESPEACIIDVSGSNILAGVHALKENLQEVRTENSVCKQRCDGLSQEISSALSIVKDVSRLVKGLGQDMQQSDKGETPRLYGESVKGVKGPDSSVASLLWQVKQDLEDLQHIRKAEKVSVSNEALLLKQELETAKEQLEKHAKELESAKDQLEMHAKHSADASDDYNKKLQSLTEELTRLKAEKETILAELSISLAKLRELELSLKKAQEGGNVEVTTLRSEKEALAIEIKNLKVKNQEQSMQFDVSRKELNNAMETIQKAQESGNKEITTLRSEKEALATEIKILKAKNQEQSMQFEGSTKELNIAMDTLKKKLASMKAEHSGSIDSVEELRKTIQENRGAHEQALQQWESKKRSLEEERQKMRDDMNALVLELQSLKAVIVEREQTIEKVTKARIDQAESFKQEMARVTHEQAGSGNAITNLQVLLKEREAAVVDLESRYKKTIEDLTKEKLEIQQEARMVLEGLTREKREFQQEIQRLLKQLDGLQQSSIEVETSSKEKFKALAAEVLRLGGEGLLN